jgi:DNA-binding transcriptional MerR regulator
MTWDAKSIEINGICYIHAAEVARSLGVSPSTLTRWRKEGKVPAGHRFRNGMILFRSEEVDAVRDFALRIEPAGTHDEGPGG